MKPSLILAGAHILSLTLLTFPAVGQGPTPTGPEYRVDDYLLTEGQHPAMTLSTDGDLVVVWQSSDSPGNDTDGSVQGKKLTANGVASFNQVQLNSYTLDRDELPDVGPLPDGGFVVVWGSKKSPDNDNSDMSVQFRRFDRDGNGLAPQFQVNTYTFADQYEPRVATAADGSFVIVWESDADFADTSFKSVHGRRYDSAGLPLADSFLVNTGTTNSQADPAVASWADGSFIVVWNSGVSSGTDVDGDSIQGQRYASDGSPVATEFQINTYTTSRQEFPDVAVAPSGEFVVVWKSLGSSGSDSDQFSLQGQRYASDGTMVGDQFQINTTTTGAQDEPRVGMADDGSFTVVWHQSNNVVNGQSFASDGSPLGAELVLSSPGVDTFSDDAAIAVDAAGDFFVTWDTSNGVQARRFRFTSDVGDRVWEDLNRNGLQDPGEPGMEGVPVDLKNDLAQTVASTLTDENGHFLFKQIEPGNYSLSFGKLDPFDEFTIMNAGDDLLDSDVDANGDTASFTLAASESDLSWDAGMKRRNVGDRVWLDLDADGLQDGNEPGRSGVLLTLYAEDFSFISSTITGPFGLYGFAGVPEGRYHLSIQIPAGFVLTAQNQGADDTVDSDADPHTLTTAFFDVVEGQADLSLDFGLVGNGWIHGRIWLDGNGDGLHDGGESGVAAVMLELFNEAGISSGTAATNESGEYNFTDVGPGTYYVHVTPPAGFGFTAQDQGTDDAVDSDFDPQLLTSRLFVFEAGEVKTNLDGGLIPAASIEGLVWRDADLDGIRDGGEPRVPNVSVELFADNGSSQGTATTAPDGSYRFSGLAAGSYYVEFTPPAGFYLTAQNQGADDTIDSDADPFTFTTAPFALADGQVETHVDAGLVGEGSVGDRIWHDEDRDGIQDVGESDAEGVSIELFDAAGASQGTALSAADGSYSFAGVGPGTYYVSVTPPNGFGFTAQNQGADGAVDSDIDPNLFNSPLFDLAAGEDRGDLDAGLIPGASIEGRAWSDFNGDGLQGVEPGQGGVVIELLNTDFVSFGQVTTGSGGDFTFAGLPAGTYFMSFSAPSGFYPTLQNQGNDDSIDSDLDPSSDTVGPFELAEGQVETGLDAGFVGEGSIGDRVWFDTDGDGIYDVGETGPENVQLQLYTDSGLIQGSASTGPNGFYGFTGVGPGSYYVRIIPPAGFGLSAQDQGADDTVDSDFDPTQLTSPVFTLAAGQDKRDLDAGLVPAASIGDRIWLDTDGDGLQDGGEPGVGGATLELFDVAGVSQGTTMSSGDGSYVFLTVDPGTYYLKLTPPPGFGVTAQNQGVDDAWDSDFDPEQLTSLPFTLAAGETRRDLDAGLLSGGTVGGRAWLDADLDGLQDGGEGAMGGVAVELFALDGTSMGTTSTAGEGTYVFNDVPAGTYYLSFGEPVGFCFTAQDQGTDDSRDSDVDPVSLTTAAFSAGPGQATSLDAGLVPDASVGNRVWLDDGNGIQDGGEAGLAGVTVQLYDAQGTLIDTAITDGDGFYGFSPGPGEYYLSFTLPAQHAFAPRDQGSDDGADSDVNPASGTTSTFVLGPGTVDSSRDAGLEPATIGNLVWLDVNGDGRRQPGEPGRAGVTVRLLDETDLEIATDITDFNGLFGFSGIATGTYRLEFEAPTDGVFSAQDVGANAHGADLIDSDVDPASGRTDLFNYTAGSALRNYDAGLQLPPLLVDGFESGDTSAWSQTVP